MTAGGDGRFPTLRDLVMHHARRRGWRTQRHVAVACGLDETAFSRFLDGRQDIGAVRTFALFREVGVPVDDYPLAFELLDRSQRLARELTEARRAVSEAAPSLALPPPAAAPTMQPPAAYAERGAPAPPPAAPAGAVPQPASLARRPALPRPVALSGGEAARLFLAESFSGEQIAAFFAAGPPD